MKDKSKRDTDALYQAMLARDSRFDGKFFVGVKTTGIYCRPVCPARPKAKNIEFFPDNFSAEKAGYRPCLRCRPECAPLSPAWIGKSAVVGRALKLISSRKLFDSSEDEFAESLGISARHLRRLFKAELGKTPKQISDINRLDFARKLLSETSLPITEIAFASGFSSIRRFNDAMKKRFHRAPTGLRRTRGDQQALENGIQLSLPYRPPLDWESLQRFFESHLLVGVESFRHGAYERVFRFGTSIGALRLEPSADKPELKLHIAIDDYKHVFQIVQKVRQMFDLDSDPMLVAESLSRSALFAKLCRKHPGLRLPGCWDAFEVSVGAIVEQMTPRDQARQLMRQLITNYGERVTHPFSGEEARLFPSPETLAQAPLNHLKTTKDKKEAIREFSRQVLSREISLEPTQDSLLFREKLLRIKGIETWTPGCIALRALGDTDVFPEKCLAFERPVKWPSGLDIEAIRPWRAYAAAYLWKEHSKKLSRKGKTHGTRP